MINLEKIPLSAFRADRYDMFYHGIILVFQNNNYVGYIQYDDPYWIYSNDIYPEDPIEGDYELEDLVQKLYTPAYETYLVPVTFYTNRD